MTRSTETRRSRRDLLLRRGLAALALLVVAGLVTFLVRGDAGGGQRSDAAASSTAAPPAPGTAEPTETTTPPSPATEEAAPSVVARDGVPEESRTVDVAPTDFATAAEWSDGVNIRVTEARQQVTEGTGPGERSGQPQTVFTLELTNGAGGPLDVNGVVVQAIYGSPPSQASPIYDAETVDFGGTVDPGAIATAVYSFAIPDDQLGDVTLSVDVDGHRYPAVFSGAVPV